MMLVALQGTDLIVWDLDSKGFSLRVVLSSLLRWFSGCFSKLFAWGTLRLETNYKEELVAVKGLWEARSLLEGTLKCSISYRKVWLY